MEKRFFAPEPFYAQTQLSVIPPENHSYIARLYGKRADIAKALGREKEAQAFKQKKQDIEEAIERNK